MLYIPKIGSIFHPRGPFVPLWQVPRYFGDLPEAPKSQHFILLLLPFVDALGSYP